jgi:hypothetical protein
MVSYLLDQWYKPSVEFRMKLQWLLPVILIAAAVFAGCLGGDSKSNEEPEYEAFTSGMNLVGAQDGLSQAVPVELTALVPVTLDYERVIKIQINITIADGDPDTNPDTVGNMELRETATEGEPNATTINGGNASPGADFETSVVIEWQNGEYLNSRWEIFIPVTIDSGGDQWPGPVIWRGIPDRGFTYALDITYEYHEDPDMV